MEAHGTVTAIFTPPEALKKMKNQMQAAQLGGGVPLFDPLLDLESPAHAQVRAACTTRQGGCSQAPYDSLNLGDHVGDDPLHVRANRQRLQQALGVRPVFLQQVHGTDVLVLDGHTPDGCVADACITSVPGIACTVLVADCLPVLFSHRQGGVVAAAHAGWRGLLGTGGRGVLENVFAAFCQHPDAPWAGAAPEHIAKDVQVWLGPCIGPQAFEVGAEVRAAFCAAQGAVHDGAQDGFAAHCFVPAGGAKFFADLPALARQRLRALGLTALGGNDSSAAWCTVNNPSVFFSHRYATHRGTSSGRLAACIWLV
jgi:YfiH family protein